MSFVKIDNKDTSSPGKGAINQIDINKNPVNTSSLIQRAMLLPLSLSPEEILNLQNSIGNRAVTRLLKTNSIMNSSDRNLSCTDDMAVSSGVVQRKSGFLSVVKTGHQYETDRQNGLPDDLKTRMENMAGLSLDDVQVHYNSQKPMDLDALAFTCGKHIYVAPGQERHLPHEAWHVVQQRQGRVRATSKEHGLDVNDNLELEAEADKMNQLPGSMQTEAGKQPIINSRHTAVQAKRDNYSSQMKWGDSKLESSGVFEKDLPAHNSMSPAIRTRFISEQQDDVSQDKITPEEFLGRLQIEISQMADEVLAQIGESSFDCPYITYWFSYYQNQAGEHIERAIRRFAPNTREAQNLDEYISLLKDKVRMSLQQSIDSGEVRGVPDELPNNLHEESPAAESAPEPGAISGVVQKCNGSKKKNTNKENKKSNEIKLENIKPNEEKIINEEKIKTDDKLPNLPPPDYYQRACDFREFYEKVSNGGITQENIEKEIMSLVSPKLKSEIENDISFKNYTNYCSGTGKIGRDIFGLPTGSDQNAEGHKPTTVENLSSFMTNAKDGVFNISAPNDIGHEWIMNKIDETFDIYESDANAKSRINVFNKNNCGESSIKNSQEDAVKKTKQIIKRIDLYNKKPGIEMAFKEFEKKEK